MSSILHGNNRQEFPSISLCSKIKISTITGQNIPCRRSNQNWFIFNIPRNVHVIHLENADNPAVPIRIKEAILFIEGRAVSIPIERSTHLPTSLKLPHIPYWVGNALCIRPEKNETDHPQE